MSRQLGDICNGFPDEPVIQGLEIYERPRPARQPSMLNQRPDQLALGWMPPPQQQHQQPIQVQQLQLPPLLGSPSQQQPQPQLQLQQQPHQQSAIVDHNAGAGAGVVLGDSDATTAKVDKMLAAMGNTRPANKRKGGKQAHVLKKPAAVKPPAPATGTSKTKSRGINVELSINQVLARTGFPKDSGKPVSKAFQFSKTSEIHKCKKLAEKWLKEIGKP